MEGVAGEIEQPKSHGRDGEEVHRCDCLPMVLQKREPSFRIQREIVLSETSNPSIRSSPWIRGAPQVAFSATIRNIRLRTSFEIRFRPITHRALEIARQYNLNPVQCQPTTVSGLTTMRACFQPDQNLRAKTQKILSNARSLGLGCFRFRMASCCRRTRFSSRRVRRACKHRKMVVTNSKSMRNIAERAR